jgi:pimeloyl-ACP methyl ester carboxylesterase
LESLPLKEKAMRKRRYAILPAFAVGLIVVAGCGRSAHNIGSVVTAKARAADGVAVAYDVRGQGDMALVFIHGWACDRSFWREQLDVFAEDYRVVALDLGGHGESGADREAWSMTTLGGDVQAVVENLNLERVVLVGHSMGGVVALEAARLMPQRVVGIVGVDTLHDAEVEYSPELAREAVALFRADFRETMVTKRFAAVGMKLAMGERK